MTAGRRYRITDPTVRQDAVDRVLGLCAGGMSRTRAARAVATDLQVHPNSVMNWVAAAAGPTTATNEADLRRQVAHLSQLLADSQAYVRTLLVRLGEPLDDDTTTGPR